MARVVVGVVVGVLEREHEVTSERGLIFTTVPNESVQRGQFWVVMERPGHGDQVRKDIVQGGAKSCGNEASPQTDIGTFWEVLVDGKEVECEVR